MKGKKDSFVIQVLEQVMEGKMKKRRAAAALEITPQYVTKLTKRLKAEGPGFLTHGNTGKPGPKRMDAETKRRKEEEKAMD